LETAGALGAHAVIRKPAHGSPLPKGQWLGTIEKLIGPPNSRKLANAAGCEPSQK
jgi:hypothetical protein